MRNTAAVFAFLLLVILAGLASATDWQTVVALDFGQFLATRQAATPAPPPVDPDDDEIGQPANPSIDAAALVEPAPGQGGPSCPPIEEPEPTAGQACRPPGRWITRPVRTGLFGRRIIHVFEYRQP